MILSTIKLTKKIELIRNVVPADFASFWDELWNSKIEKKLKLSPREVLKGEVWNSATKRSCNAFLVVNVLLGCCRILTSSVGSCQRSVADRKCHPLKSWRNLSCFFFRSQLSWDGRFVCSLYGCLLPGPAALKHWPKDSATNVRDITKCLVGVRCAPFFKTKAFLGDHQTRAIVQGHSFGSLDVHTFFPLKWT